MKELNRDTYLIALSHIQDVSTKTVNGILKEFGSEAGAYANFFELTADEMLSKHNIPIEEAVKIAEFKSQLPNFAFLNDNLVNQGFTMVAASDSNYPANLINNLGYDRTPSILYLKGDIEIFKEQCIAIVGSRDANEDDLNYTALLSKKATQEFKVVVSGFAKGVDKKALDSALELNGKSILVLPQGILTFKSGINEYYKKILSGDVLILSTFYPTAPWLVKLAMARNAYIYGLAGEIYIPKTNDSGGTWAGATSGIKKGRKVYVRYLDGKLPANLKLIELGAIPLDEEGDEIKGFVRGGKVNPKKKKNIKPPYEEGNLFEN
ncbi:MAG: DNA-processing protein DprA [Ignavibacteriaceae bacterium]|nr:DNA-processing protein DprA [Ignavibacteriaceae bacterium]